MFSLVKNNIDFAHKLDKPSSPTEEYFKHIHYFNEILYLVHGDIKFTVESETRQLAEGDLVFIPSGKYHFATVNQDLRYERYVLKFPDKFVPDFVHEKLNTGAYYFTNSKKYELIFNLFDGYIQEYNEDEAYTLFIAELLKLITMLCHEHAQLTEKHGDFIEQLIDYIDTHLQTPLTIQSLTEKFHYSKSFINTEFKRRMHVPIMKYIRTKKVIAAHQMILSGVKKTEVAEIFGFETYSTFYRIYKKMLQTGYEDLDI